MRIWRCWNISLTERQDAILKNNDGKSYVAEWLVSMVFLVLAVILLLNMLIAMMSETFQTAIAAGPTNFAFTKAHRVILMHREPPTPAPLYVLSLPFEVVDGIARAARLLLCELLPDDTHEPGQSCNEAVKPSVESVDRLKETVTQYILNYQFDGGEDKLWRTKI